MADYRIDFPPDRIERKIEGIAKLGGDRGSGFSDLCKRPDRGGDGIVGEQARTRGVEKQQRASHVDGANVRADQRRRRVRNLAQKVNAAAFSLCNTASSAGAV